jgi:uncharacterized protein YndB with AHSA1/START domain
MKIVCAKIICAEVIWEREEASMWSIERSAETTAAPEAVWRLWSDVERWPGWNADLERAELAGPFAAGSTITMHQRGGDRIELRIAETREPDSFVDEADLGDVVVRTSHLLERVGKGRVRIVYRMEITGPQADTMGPQIGPQISADFPQVLAALIERVGP